MIRVGNLVVGLCVFLGAGAAGFLASRHTADPRQSTTADQQLLESARAAIERRRFSDAISLVRSVDAQSPIAAEAKLMEGIALWRLNFWHKAEMAWLRALELDPKVPQAAWHLLDVYFIQHRWSDAEKLALRVYPVEPHPRDRTKLLLELVRQDTERLAPADTVRALEPVATAEPTNYHAQRVLGVSLVQLGRVSEGIRRIERATAMDPDKPDAWISLVWSLLETGQADVASGVWDRIPQAAMTSGELLRYRGLWAETEQDFESAERAYRRSLELDPFDRKTHYLLAQLVRRNGDETTADSHATESRRLDDAREQLAKCYALANQQNDDPTPELCNQFAAWCRELGRVAQADCWDQEHARRLGKTAS